jgi:hypothetical protein
MGSLHLHCGRYTGVAFGHRLLPAESPAILSVRSPGAVVHGSTRGSTGIMRRRHGTA